MAKARPLVFVTLDSGCMVCISHRPNSAGYFVKVWRRFNTEVFHRLIYRAHFGPIPEGMEVDHRCRLRCCCNPAHLRLATRTQNVHNSIKPTGQYPRGVSRANSKYQARACGPSGRTYLGVHDTPEAASLAVEAFLEKHRGEFYIA